LSSLLDNSGGRLYPAALAIAGAVMALFWPGAGWLGIAGALVFIGVGVAAWLQLSNGNPSRKP
jgi:methyl-accepting chemotaxis protein